MGLAVIGGRDVLWPDHGQFVVELAIADPGDAYFERELVAVGFVGDEVEDPGQRSVGDRKHRVGHGCLLRGNWFGHDKLLRGDW